MKSPNWRALYLDAQWLLDRAANECPVRLERLKELAADAMATLPDDPEVTRLGVAVLEGGLFASRRALELAVHVRRALVPGSL